MKILITGAAGFLGLHLTNSLYEKNHDLTLLDIADFDKREYPNEAQSKTTGGQILNYVKGDVRNPELVEKILSNSDVVIHAAAALPLCPSKEIFDTNVNGTQNILKLSLKHGVKHFIHISSTAVYGIPKVHPIYENAVMVGVGDYGRSKIAAEKLCIKYRDLGLNITVIRPKTFVGTHRLGVFEILFDWVKDGKKIPIIGNGNNKYQLLDVADLVEIINLAVNTEDKKKLNDAFNIGAKEFKTVKEDLAELFAYAKSGSKTLATPAWPLKKSLWVLEQLKLSPIYQWVYDTADKDSFVSIEKLCKALNTEPKSSNAQALIKSYQWYLDNYDEIKSRPVGVTHTTGWDQGLLKFFKKFL